MAAIESPLKERITPERLLDLRGVLDDLVRAKIVTQRDAEDILIAPRTAKQLHMHPLEIIAERELDDPRRPGKKLDLDQLTHWLCELSGQPYYRIDPLKVNVNKTTEVMSYAFAQRHNILAVEVREEEIVIASAQPFMSAWEGMLVQTLRGRRIVRVVTNPQELTRYMLEFYTMARSVAKASDAGLEVSNITNFEQMLELGQLKSPDANDAHIVNIVDWLLQYAFDQRASDIHIEPRRDKGHVRFRIDGVMHHVYELPPAVNAAVTSRLKILGRMDVAEKRRPQDGRVKTKSPDGHEVELRLSTLPTAFGEKMVARIFDPDVLLRSFQELGLGGDDNQRWQTMVEREQRHRAGHRPDRFRQDHHAVFDVETARDAAGERLHHRRPDRDGRAVVQPDAGAAQHQAVVRVRRALTAAAGPGHHHGRRDPRPRNRRDGDPGGADRSPRDLDAAHQRRAERDHPADRPRRCAVSDQSDRASA